MKSAVRRIRLHMRPIRKLWSHFYVRMQELPYRYRCSPLGSADWFIGKEVTYGGYVTGVPRLKVSSHDARSNEKLDFHGMTGGDRMLHHHYGPIYSRFLAPFIGQSNLTVAEFGILTGTGLAVWCDLFPSARVIGFDIDLSHFKNNLSALKKRGAFKHNYPELYEFDQLDPDTKQLSTDLNGAKVDIVIDDGLHTLSAIIENWRAVKPHLAKRFVYFVEDFDGLFNACDDEFAGFDTREFGLMTVISRGLVLS